ncbi:MAG TPA: hypothetical protein PKZ17_06200 [Thermodesulfovibrio thiophilus]|nr:hypothetical protein [Thermodesulfovibrio thiophilus]
MLAKGAVAIGFARQGADIFLTAKEDKQGMDEVLKEIRGLEVQGEGGLYDAANFNDVQKIEWKNYQSCCSSCIQRVFWRD